MDAGLVLQQVGAICRSFQTRRDLAHFLSDRAPLQAQPPLDKTPVEKPHSPSASEATQAL